MRFALFLGVLALGLATVVLLVDDQLEDVLRTQLARFSLDEVLAFEQLVVHSPEAASVRGATLRDPATGRVVAHVERLDATLDVDVSLTDPANPGVALTSLRGRGGRVLLRYEEGDLGLVRAAVALVDHIASIPVPAGAGPAPLPEIAFDDLEVVVHSEDFPLERYVGASVRVVTVGDPADHRIDVVVDAGPRSGSLRLLFGRDGLRRMEADALRLSPALTTLDPAGQDILRQGFSPRGYLDAVADLETDRAWGALEEAYVDTEYVPFLLGPARIPFEVDEEGLLLIERAVFGFEAGEVVFSLRADADTATMRIDVDDAVFEERFLLLVPGYEDWEDVTCEDGGTFECHLDLVVAGDPAEVAVTGDGGFHIERVDSARWGLVAEDVVGRFEVTDQDVLSFPEVSARFSGGRLRGSGTLDLADDEYRLSLAAEDLDFGRLHASLVTKYEPGTVAGWMQGDLRARGRLHDPDSFLGEGQFSVRGGNFWETNTFEQILKVLTLSRGQDAHQRVETSFTVKDKVVRFDPLAIQSDVLSLAGSGTVRFNERIRFELRPVPVGLGMFGQVLDTLKEELLVKLEVRGTLDDPRVTAIPLNIVARPFRRFWSFLFGEPVDG